MKVFLGGTVNGSTWRDSLIPQLQLTYFNPVVPDWTEAAYQQELQERESCDFLLYVITPKATGFYSIAELVDDSNKRPGKTIYMLMKDDGDAAFSPHQLRSLEKIGKMIQENGAHWLDDLAAVAHFLNAAEAFGETVM